MRKINQLLRLTLVITCLSTAGVWAHNDGGADGHEEDIMTITQQVSNENARPANNVENQLRGNLARQTAEERVEMIQQQVEIRKETIKQDVCERRQEQLQNTLPKLSNGATNVKNTIDTVYERVVGFYESGQLTVNNYQELTTNINTAKIDAETSLEAISNFQIEIDCTNNSIGEQLDAYRTAITDARESLKLYRDNLVVLISSMRAEAAENINSTTGTEESTMTNQIRRRIPLKEKVMNKQLTKQQVGSEIIAALAVVVIASVIGVTGWYIYNNQDETVVPNATTSEQQAESQAPAVQNTDDLEEAENFLNNTNIDQQLDTSEIDQALSE